MGTRIRSAVVWLAIVVCALVCRPAKGELVMNIQTETDPVISLPFMKVSRFAEVDGTPRGTMQDSTSGNLGYSIGQGAFGPDGSYHFLTWVMGFNFLGRLNWPSSASAATYSGSILQGAPGKITVAPNGRLLVSGNSNSTYWAWVFSPTNWTLLKALRTTASGLTPPPVGIASPSNDQLVLVNSRARFFSGNPSSGGPSGLLTEAAIATIDSSSGQATYGLTNVTVGGMTLGPDGNLYVSDYAAHSILRIDPRVNPNLPQTPQPTFTFLDIFVSGRAGGLDSPTHLAFGSDGFLYVYSSADRSVLRFHPTTGRFEGRLLQLPAGEFATSLAFSPPVPELAQRKTGESVHLEWSSRWTNYVLQATANPADLVSWTNITALPSTNGSFLSLTNASGSDQGFFRLRRTN